MNDGECPDFFLDLRRRCRVLCMGGPCNEGGEQHTCGNETREGPKHHGISGVGPNLPRRSGARSRPRPLIQIKQARVAAPCPCASPLRWRSSCSSFEWNIPAAKDWLRGRGGLI